jgi:hypothetical protein
LGSDVQHKLSEDMFYRSLDISLDFSMDTRSLPPSPTTTNFRLKSGLGVRPFS